MSGWVLVLPYIEQAGLYEKLNQNLAFSDEIWDNSSVIRNNNCIDPNNPTGGPSTAGATGTPGNTTSTVNMPFMSTRLNIFICPSDPASPRTYPGSAPLNRYGPVIGMSGMMSNYDFITNAGGDQGTCNYWRSLTIKTRYMFGENSTTRLVDIQDGTTNTLMLGETTVGGTCNGLTPLWGYRPWTGTGLNPASTTSGRGINDWTANWSWSTCGTPGGNNPPRLGRLGNWDRVGSYHTGGANFALGDGSVRFVAESVLATILRQYAYIADGTTPSLDN
jgi:prepilin-type processing-associated H-X9-DG protein